jgi:predicted peroxiredoxin
MERMTFHVHFFLSTKRMVRAIREEVKRTKDEKFILYVQTSDKPERQYSPLVLAQTAKTMGLNPKVYFLGMGLKILIPGAAEKIKLGTFPTVAEMLQKTMQMGIEIDVCEASKRMLGWEKVELIPGVKIVGAATLNDLALDASATMWF